MLSSRSVASARSNRRRAAVGGLTRRAHDRHAQPVTISIPSAGLDTTGSFTVYRIHVRVGSQRELVRLRRFREFKALRRVLCRQGREVPQRLLDLPPSRVFGRFEPSVVEHRRQALEAFLVVAARAVGINPTTAAPSPLRQFLGLDDADGSIVVLSTVEVQRHADVLTAGVQWYDSVAASTGAGHHVVYAVCVHRRSARSARVVFRRYREFLRLHTCLMQQFPVAMAKAHALFPKPISKKQQLASARHVQVTHAVPASPARRQGRQRLTQRLKRNDAARTALVHVSESCLASLDQYVKALLLGEVTRELVRLSVVREFFELDTAAAHDVLPPPAPASDFLGSIADRFSAGGSVGSGGGASFAHGIDDESLPSGGSGMPAQASHGSGDGTGGDGSSAGFGGATGGGSVVDAHDSAGTASRSSGDAAASTGATHQPPVLPRPPQPVFVNLFDGSPARSFEVVASMGQGAYGAVYKARHRRTNCVVALKVMKPARHFGPEDMRREAELLQRCQSPFVTQYYGSCFASGRMWIAMEYCAAGSLDDIMTASNLHLREAAICRVVGCVALALAHMHSLGVVHRDVKAGNILLTHQAQPRLADFGTAVQLTDEFPTASEQVGSAFWAAPEVVRQAQYDTCVDVWSLGITALELALGEPPLMKFHPQRAMLLTRDHPPPCAAELLPAADGWSPEFADLVQCCLTKDPRERIHIEDLLDHPALDSTMDELLADEDAHLDASSFSEAASHGGGSGDFAAHTSTARRNLSVDSTSSAVLGGGSSFRTIGSSSGTGHVDDGPFAVLHSLVDHGLHAMERKFRSEEGGAPLVRRRQARRGSGGSALAQPRSLARAAAPPPPPAVPPPVPVPPSPARSAASSTGSVLSRSPSTSASSANGKGSGLLAAISRFLGGRRSGKSRSHHKDKGAPPLARAPTSAQTPPAAGPLRKGKAVLLRQQSRRSSLRLDDALSSLAATASSSIMLRGPHAPKHALARYSGGELPPTLELLLTGSSRSGQGDLADRHGDGAGSAHTSGGVTEGEGDTAKGGTAMSSPAGADPAFLSAVGREVTHYRVEAPTALTMVSRNSGSSAGDGVSSAGGSTVQSQAQARGVLADALSKDGSSTMVEPPSLHASAGRRGRLDVVHDYFHGSGSATDGRGQGKLHRQLPPRPGGGGVARQQSAPIAMRRQQRGRADGTVSSDHAASPDSYLGQSVVVDEPRAVFGSVVVSHAGWGGRSIDAGAGDDAGAGCDHTNLDAAFDELE